MLTKFKTHLNTPITWGKYYKLSGICCLISMVISLGFTLKYLYDWGYWRLPKFKKKETEKDEP